MLAGATLTPRRREPHPAAGRANGPVVDRRAERVGVVFSVVLCVSGRAGRSVGLVVGRLHLGRDAAAVRHLVPVGPSPLANGTEVAALDAAGRSGAASRGGPAARAAATGVARPRGELVAQLLGVLVRKVYLVGDSVERERHCLGGVTAVEVVDQLHFDTLSHVSPSALSCRRGYIRVDNPRTASIYTPSAQNGLPAVRILNVIAV